MLWDGNRQIQEYTDEQIFTTVYEQGSFEPVARVVQLSAELEKRRIAEKILYVEQHVPYGIINQDFYDRIEQAKTPLVQIYHYHCNHLGTPQELSDESGNIVWLSYDRAWGGSFDTIYKQQFIDNFAITANELQPIKFQGQFFDVETNLHYNRFRYYDSDVGMFISRDPIGLMGGNNVFQYAPNPIGWIDPWGLANESVYRLLDSNGNTIYYGITDRSPPARGNEHINDGKVFSKMEVLAEGLSHDEARTIEGVLIRNRINPADLGKPVEVQLKNSGLINKNRGRVETRWISDNPLEDLKHRFLEKPKNVELKKLNPCSK